MVVWWFVIAMTIAACISAFVPLGVFHTYLNNSPSGLLLTLSAATVLEICSEGTSVLAFDLYRNTGALGHVFVFLLAGVATDYTEIGLLWQNVGKRQAILLPLITVPQILIIGFLFNFFF